MSKYHGIFTSHLEINGKPLCKCEAHHSGLMNRLGLSCEYPNQSEASEAAIKVFRSDRDRFRKGGDLVQVVLGECPAFKSARTIRYRTEVLS